MAEIRIPADSLTLRCSLTCCTMEKWSTNDSGAPESLQYTDAYVSSSPQVDIRLVEFELPEDVVVKSAKLHAKRASDPAFGVKMSTINNEVVGSTAEVEIAIEKGATSVSVPFAFLCQTPTHWHDSDSGDWTSMSNRVDENDPALPYYRYYYWQHSSYLTYSDIYLVLEVEGSSGGYIYLGEGGKLVPYQLCRAEGGKLVPYQFHKAEGGKLVPY